MINGVELALLNKAKDMRKFHCYNAVTSQRDLESFHEIIDIRNVRQYIVTDKQVAFSTLRLQLFSKRGTEVLRYSRDPLKDRNVGCILSRFNTKYGNPTI